ncbi:hypothetical protein AVEN_272220-1 [Araneus ventricosus]|uniref:Uncharacterized protein n=1 Tax=Araneus ventricosus TaxID=182803 RepID=A0A4Y2Q0Q8_ARAVE|nr:hypothetical protein AVEN_272220-1 [Araneus ventricosus]
MEGKAFGRILPFHVRDCIIDPDATVESGPVLFLGCPETFGDFNSTSSDGTVDQVRSVGDDTLQNDLMGFRILSDYMCKLCKGKFDADMLIRSYFEGVFAEDEYQDRIRKGILAARVSELWRGLQKVPRTNGVPEIPPMTIYFKWCNSSLCSRLRIHR